MMFFERERTWQSPLGKSKNIEDVVPEDFEPSKKFRPKKFFTCYSDIYSPIKDVIVCPFKDAQSKEIIDFCKEEIERKQVDTDKFARKMWNEMKRIIEEVWDPKKFHVLHISSGYDGRLITSVIRELYEEKGKDWFGDSIFIEAHGEPEQAKLAIELQGWDPKLFIIQNENAKDKTEYFARTFENFKDSWKKGLTGYPINVWYEPIDWLQAKGIAPRDDLIQGFTGYGSNEISKVLERRSDGNMGQRVGYKGNTTIGGYMEWAYKHALSAFRMKGNWIHPWYEIDLLRTLIKYCNKQPILHEDYNFSKCIVETIKPKMKIPKKMYTEDVRETGYAYVSDRLMKICYNDYKNSWYGKHLYPDIEPINNFVSYNCWWGHWRCASFFEYLRNR